MNAGHPALEPNPLDPSALEPSALVAFRAENVRSYRDQLELSLLATRLSERNYIRELPWREGGKPLGVLPAAAIIGANASGKSNVLRALYEMRRGVVFSHDPVQEIPAWRAPFRLEEAGVQRPSRYEVELVLSGVLHRYGFIVDEQQVRKEWAVRFPHGRAALIFEREGMSVRAGVGGRAQTRNAQKLLRRGALLLSSAAAIEHQLLSPLFSWFFHNLGFVGGPAGRLRRQAFTANLLQDQRRRENVLELLRSADLGITDARVLADLHPLESPRRGAATERSAANAKGSQRQQEQQVLRVIRGVALSHIASDGEIELDPNEESAGTLTWLELVGPVIDVLSRGSVLLLDELDGVLHPRLAALLVELFQNPDYNPRCAQLILSTHNTSLLGGAGQQLLGRDQIWLAEKQNDGRSRLVDLGAYSPRKGEALATRYLVGHYGAVPFIQPPELNLDDDHRRRVA